jgi:hypothetical protein
MEFIYAETMDDVLKVALKKNNKRKSKKKVTGTRSSVKKR